VHSAHDGSDPSSARTLTPLARALLVAPISTNMIGEQGELALRS
jgi:hypothetical protein